MFKSLMIAPCGINCGTCIGHLREKKKCAGCNYIDSNKPIHCIACSIKNCEYLQKSKSRFCFNCEKFPCTRLKSLDKRYRKTYNTSLIENLNNIKASGIRKYMSIENKKWICTNCGGTLSVHRKECLICGEKTTPSS